MSGSRAEPGQVGSGPEPGRWRARRPLPRASSLGLRVAGLTAVVLVLGGLAFKLPPSLVAALVVATFALTAVAALIGTEELFWPAPRDETAAPGWSQVALLSHSVAVAESSPWEFDAVVRPRLRRLAEGALARDGVDWSSPDARDELGPELYAALSGDPADRWTWPELPAGLTRTKLARGTLDTIDRLDTARGRTT